MRRNSTMLASSDIPGRGVTPSEVAITWMASASSFATPSSQIHAPSR